MSRRFERIKVPDARTGGEQILPLPPAPRRGTGTKVRTGFRRSATGKPPRERPTGRTAKDVAL
ncbi:hypothetical protein GCM10010406_14070 [Streptomyces thermolineatus]|uniref:Uncharacterized protein n=1 Tax=Streptomyces thermolineatus TaxID=44033 RepID=A0ABN3LA71_9ACTN